MIILLGRYPTMGWMIPRTSYTMFWHVLTMVFVQPSSGKNRGFHLWPAQLPGLGQSARCQRCDGNLQSWCRIRMHQNTGKTHMKRDFLVTMASGFFDVYHVRPNVVAPYSTIFTGNPLQVVSVAVRCNEVRHGAGEIPSMLGLQGGRWIQLGSIQTWDG